MRKALPLLLACLLVPLARPASGQNGFAAARETAVSTGIAAATDFSVPASPAFALLGVEPAQVHAPSFPRDVRLAWIAQDDQLVSDLAIEAAPVWLWGFRRVSAASYRQMSPALRTLSTLSTSIGTAEQDDARFLALSAKLTLYRSADPLTDTTYLHQIAQALAFDETETQAQLRVNELVFTVMADPALTDAQQRAFEAVADALLNAGTFEPATVSAYQTLSRSERAALAPYLDRLRIELETLYALSASTVQQLQRLRTAYERVHWNAARVDLGVGRLYAYDSPAFDSLALQGSGYGLWLNGATGLGTDRLLLSGLGHLVRLDEQTRYFLGGNLRYGHDDAHFFVEYAHAWRPDGDQNVLAYGGAFALSDRFTVQFGLRTAYDGALQPISLLPLVMINGQALSPLTALF